MAGNSALDRTFEVIDSVNDTLNKEAACNVLLLTLIEAVILRVSKVVWIQRNVIVM
jgi:hypothetical protein